MPNLVIYVPFAPIPAGMLQGDLRTNAVDVFNQAAVPFQLNGLVINNVIVVFAGGEAANPVAPGDILVVHGHGGQNNTVIGDNLGANITQAQLFVNLGVMTAGNAAMAFFVICFSAEHLHSGVVWAAGHPATQVYGSDQIVGGALAQITRQGTIRSALFRDDDTRMLHL
jgi:hypothetical protein